jgi:uncharacterized membrane protein
MILVMNKKYEWLFVLVFIALPFAYAFYLYPSLPLRIPIHFNIKGEADGWGSPESIFLSPAIMGLTSLFVYFIFANIKKLDPMRYADANADNYAAVGLGVVLFLSLLSLSILYGTVNESLRDGRFVFLLIGLFFSAFGLYMPKLKQNYFVGMRLPWTLSDADNWEATHRYAGKFWTIGGLLIALFALLLDGIAQMVVFFSIVFLVVIFPVIFSYRLFKKTKNK